MCNQKKPSAMWNASNLNIHVAFSGHLHCNYRNRHVGACTDTGGNRYTHNHNEKHQREKSHSGYKSLSLHLHPPLSNVFHMWHVPNVYFYKSSWLTGPGTTLTNAALCGTPGQTNREWQQELGGGCLSCLISALLLRMLGNGGTALWTAAPGQTTWQLSATAWRMYNVPVCLSEGGRATAAPQPVTTRKSDFSSCPVSEGHPPSCPHTHQHTQSAELRVCLSEIFFFA